MVSALINFEDGVFVDYFGSWVSRGKDTGRNGNIRLVGSKGAIELMDNVPAIVWEDGMIEHVQARTDMVYGSLLAGIALANARLGVVHGLAHPLGIRYHIPHGLVCGVLLPWAIAYNSSACADKYGDLARWSGAGQSAEDLLNWVRVTNHEMGLPTSLREFGLRREDFAWIVGQSMPSGSLRANSRPVQPEDLFDLLDTQLSR